MMLSRLIIILLSMAAFSAQCWAQPITVTDIVGREVTLDHPARRLVLGQGRYLPVLGLIDPDPVPRVVGWKDDFRRDSATFAQWQQRFPAMDSIPSVGGAGDASLSLEKTIALKPDIVLLSLFVGEVNDPEQMARIVDTLGAAGIPVLFVDFFNRPLENSSKSLRIIGRAIGMSERADAFARFYDAKLQQIAKRLSDAAPPRPSVFVHAHAGGMPCCNTAVRGVFDDIITAAGGRNVARDKLAGATGQLSLEFLISESPEFYIPTGGAHLAAGGGLVLGTSITPEVARVSFSKLIGSTGIAQLQAVEESRAFGIWHMFNDTPLNVVLVELLAKRLHPDLFADLDPRRTLSEIERRFSAVPLDGTYWYPE